MAQRPDTSNFTSSTMEQKQPLPPSRGRWRRGATLALSPALLWPRSLQTCSLGGLHPWAEHSRRSPNQRHACTHTTCSQESILGNGATVRRDCSHSELRREKTKYAMPPSSPKPFFSCKFRRRTSRFFSFHLVTNGLPTSSSLRHWPKRPGRRVSGPCTNKTSKSRRKEKKMRLEPQAPGNNSKYPNAELSMPFPRCASGKEQKKR